MVFMFISCSSYVFSFCVCSMFGHVLLFFLHMCFILGVFFNVIFTFLIIFSLL